MIRRSWYVPQSRRFAACTLLVQIEDRLTIDYRWHSEWLILPSCLILILFRMLESIVSASTNGCIMIPFNSKNSCLSFFIVLDSPCYRQSNQALLRTQIRAFWGKYILWRGESATLDDAE